MANQKELKALPSKVILCDGDIITLDELPENEKANIRSLIISNINKQLSSYYSSHEQEWATFIAAMS